MIFPLSFRSVWPWLVSILNSFQPKEDDVSCVSGKLDFWLELCVPFAYHHVSLLPYSQLR